MRVIHWASAFTSLASSGSAALSSHALLRPDVVRLHQSLVEIESISGHEQAVGDWLYHSLIQQGYHAEKQYVSRDPERFNVYAWPGENRDPPVMLTSHIDTVPPFLPYKYTKDEDHPGNSTIFGRGSVDAKGSVATQIIAINELIASSAISPNDVSLLYVVGEEIGGGGMRAANNLSLSHTQTIIFGEPTALHLVSGHKGTMQAIIRAKGKAGHSGYPWLGRSANEVLVSSLAAIMHLGDHLPTSAKYGSTTFNLGTLQGGVAANVIAQNATATIAVRIAHGTTAMIQHAMTAAIHEAVQPFLSGNGDDDDHHLTPQDIVELDFTGAGYGPVDIDHDVPGFDVITVNYGTDIPWLEKVVPDQKRYLYGPGTIFVAHGDQEELREKDLWEAVEGYQKIVLFALGKEGERGSGEEKEDL